MPDTSLEYHIITNLPKSQHHWTKPGDRPVEDEKIGAPRKVYPVQVKDFNVVNNRYLDGHEEKLRAEKRLNLLEATQKYQRDNRYDPITQQFNDPRHEENARVAEHARDVECVLRAEGGLPPTMR